MFHDVDVYLELKAILPDGDVFFIQVKGEINNALFSLVDNGLMKQGEREDELELFHSYRMQMHSSESFLVELLKVTDTSVETMELVEDPKPHDHSPPQIATVVVHVINEA
jgi:hypothetical protein